MKEKAVWLLGGAVAMLILLGLGFLVLVYSGVYTVAATEPHRGAVRWMLDTVKEISVRTQAEEIPAPVTNEEVLRHGFVHFEAMCVVCHGAPGTERGEFGQGLNPQPPRLSEAAPEWTDAQLFWIVKHGIRMTGMPAFGPTHSDEELWGLVAVLRLLPTLSAEEYQRRVEAVDAEDHHDHEHGDHEH